MFLIFIILLIIIIFDCCEIKKVISFKMSLENCKFLYQPNFIFFMSFEYYGKYVINQNKIWSKTFFFSIYSSIICCPHSGRKFLNLVEIGKIFLSWLEKLKKNLFFNWRMFSKFLIYKLQFKNGLIIEQEVKASQLEDWTNMKLKNYVKFLDQFFVIIKNCGKM